MNFRRVIAIAALTAWTAGCGSEQTTSQQAVHNADPHARMASIAQGQPDADERRMWELIESLESDDPAVRMMAIASLERLTGTRRGFEPYDSFEARQVAVDRWHQSMAQGQEQER
jgi:hypothetical protein